MKRHSIRRIYTLAKSTVAEIAPKLRQADRNSSDYWPATLQFIEAATWNNIDRSALHPYAFDIVPGKTYINDEPYPEADL